MAANYAIEWDRAAVDGACALLNGGEIRIYDGTRPADVGTAITDQNLLCTLSLNSPAFNAATGDPATASFAGTVSDLASATGTATWARVVTSGGAARIDGDVTGTGGGGDFTISNTSITSGQTVNLTSFTYSQS